MANYKTGAQRRNDRMEKIFATARDNGTLLQKWYEAPQGKKITLPADTTLKGMNGEPRELTAGTYYITGFWGDLCGLNRTNPNGENEVCIQSRELTTFNEIEK